jgi:hypothetical protein
MVILPNYLRNFDSFDLAVRAVGAKAYGSDPTGCFPGMIPFIRVSGKSTTRPY